MITPVLFGIIPTGRQACGQEVRPDGAGDRKEERRDIEVHQRDP